MAKNKKPAKLQSYLNEDNYIKTGKARNLPIVNCLINTDWEETGIASVIVVRQHVNQNFTLGLYMVDLYCVGVKDTHFYFNISENEFLSLTYSISQNYELADCDYNLAHNIIYGAVAYAEEFEIPPHKDFKLTKMILEEDDDNIPLIDVEFGKDGKPFLVESSHDNKTKFYYSQLLKHVGEGNFHFLSEEDQYSDDDTYPEGWEKEDWEYFLEDLENSETQEELTGKLVESFEAVRYIFEKTMVEPTSETKMLTTQGLELTEMEIVSEPVSTVGYKKSDEEIKDIESCHKDLKDIQNSTIRVDSKVEKLILKLQKAIVKWPKNPTFLNYLLSAYQLTNNVSAVRETAKLTLKLFPSYLFGKIVYARLLIQDGQLEKVPELFNGNYNLKSIYPERTKFHIQEFLAFNILMCYYFLEKDDLYMANLYYSMNTKIDVPEELMMDNEIMFKLSIRICNYVGDLVLGNNTEFTREELIKTLIN